MPLKIPFRFGRELIISYRRNSGLLWVFRVEFRTHFGPLPAASSKNFVFPGFASGYKRVAPTRSVAMEIVSDWWYGNALPARDLLCVVSLFVHVKVMAKL